MVVDRLRCRLVEHRASELVATLERRHGEGHLGLSKRQHESNPKGPHTSSQIIEPQSTAFVSRLSRI